MSDLEFRDTPALAILSQKGGTLAHIAPGDIAAAQDLLRLSKKLLAAFGEQFALHGLTPGRYALLSMLNAAAGPIAPSAIADGLGVTRATTTALVAGVVRDGLVAYVAAGTPDGRRKAIALTERGRAMMDAAIPDVFGRMAGLFKPFLADERDALVRLLKRVEDGLDGPGSAADEEHPA
jgi:DNA-binding MarR family transcriptional regulator